MTQFPTLIKQALQKNHLPAPEELVQKFAHYLTLIQTWNRVFNLTSITDPHDMVYLHLIDSLIVHPHLVGPNLLDVGSGAGLPGIPLALLNPTQEWTLLDKNSKKTRFLTQAVAELGLKQVQVTQQRTDEFHPPIYFDTILSRAFGTIRLFVETTEHLLAPHGIFIAMKGKYPQDELDDLPEHIQVQGCFRLDLVGIETERHVVILGKKNDC